MNRLSYFIKKNYYKHVEKVLSKELLSKEIEFKEKYQRDHSSNGKLKVCTYQTGYSKHFTRFYTSSIGESNSFYLVEQPEEADVVVFLNTIDCSILKPGQKAVLFFHEPLDYAHLYQSTIDWKRLKNIDIHVVSHLPSSSLFITNPEQLRYTRSIPYVHFHHMAQYDELRSVNKHIRTKQICSITSGFSGIPGYQRRRDFIEFLSVSNPKLDLYGRFGKISYSLAAYRGPCLSKWETLSSYKYNLVIENSSDEYYISEKIFDSLICGCMPIYHGSDKIFNILPKEWFYYLPTLDASEIPTLNAYLESDAYKVISDRREEISTFIYEKYSFYAALENILNDRPLSVVVN